MQESLNDINTSLEAHRLVKDPAKLLSLLFSKYGDVREDYYTSFITQRDDPCVRKMLYVNNVHWNDGSRVHSVFYSVRKSRQDLPRYPNRWEHL